MGKKIQAAKPQPLPPNPQFQLNKIHKKEIVSKVKRSLRKASPKKKDIILEDMKQIIKQTDVDCLLCLQILLRPVLAQCGHIFCLECAQHLSQKDYACAICKQYQPNFQLKVHSPTQILISFYLERCSQQEKKSYQQRQSIFQQKEEARKISSDINTGDYIDYWCTTNKCWTHQFVFKVEEDILFLPNCVRVHRLSRRAAKLKTFTKKQLAQLAQNVQQV